MSKMDYTTNQEWSAVSNEGRESSEATAAIHLSLGEVPALTEQFARTFWTLKQAYAAELGMSMVENGILTYLAREDGVPQQVLAAHLRVDPSLITRAVKEMERSKGWITRTRDERDNRLMRVRLTEAGRHQAHKLPERAAAIENRLTSVLNTDERLELHRLLQVLERSIREARRGDNISDG